MSKTVINIILIIVTVLSLGYAFVKNVEATKNAEEALRQKISADEAGMLARRSELEANKQRESAEMSAREALMAKRELEACCKKK